MYGRKEKTGAKIEVFLLRELNKPNRLWDVIVYPAHGAGSACGKNMMKETVDTLGNQKKMNYALNQPTKEAFIAAVTDGSLPPPAYFGMNEAMNKKGYADFESVLKQGLNALNVEEFELLAETSGFICS